MAIGLLIFAIALFTELLPIELLRTATNERKVSARVAVSPRKYVCQAGEVVPRATARVTFPAGTASAASVPVVLMVRDSKGRAVASGSAPAGAGDRFVFVRLGPVPRQDFVGASACVQNGGSEPLILRGESVPPAKRPAAGPGLVGGRPTSIRFDWFEAGSRRRITMAPAIAERFSFAKASFFGAWTFWAMLAAVAALSAAAIRWACGGSEA